MIGGGDESQSHLKLVTLRNTNDKVMKMMMNDCAGSLEPALVMMSSVLWFADSSAKTVEEDEERSLAGAAGSSLSASASGVHEEVRLYI